MDHTADPPTQLPDPGAHRSPTASAEYFRGWAMGYARVPRLDPQTDPEFTAYTSGYFDGSGARGAGTSAHPTPHTLTPFDVQVLRASMRRPQSVEDGLGPVILWLPAEGAYALLHAGQVVAKHRDVAILAACLRCERAERGFISRILDPTWDARTEALAPDTATAEKARQRALRASLEARADQEAEALRRRNSSLRISPTEISDDELFG